jgi:hypothetical protein
MTSFMKDYLLRKDERRRPLDWRYKRALALSKFSAKRAVKYDSDDSLILAYADLLRRFSKHESHFDLQRIRKKHPNLFKVHMAYASSNTTELALLDALLLCKSSDGRQIEDQCGLSRMQQKLYKALFLDIEDRRDMSLFIASQLLESKKLRSSAKETTLESVDDEYESDTYGDKALRVLRMVGFYSSPIVVELMYSGLLQGKNLAGPDSAMQYLNRTYLANIRRRSVLNSFTMSDSSKNMEKFMDMSFRLASETNEDNNQELLQNVDGFMFPGTQRDESLEKYAPKKTDYTEIIDVEAKRLLTV